MWNNRSAPGGAGNTTRGLTRSLDLTKEGLLVEGTRTCSIPECTKPVRARTWCSTHYGRFQRTGDPLGSKPRRQRQICSIDGCGAFVYGHGFCQNHYRRFLRGKDPSKPPILRGPGSPRWVPRESLDYGTMHERLNLQRGRARTHVCVKCGERADHWAYQHTDPNPLVSEQGCLYTDDVMAYEPMCQGCHRAYDAAMRMLADERTARTTEGSQA